MSLSGIAGIQSCFSDPVLTDELAESLWPNLWEKLKNRQLYSCFLCREWGINSLKKPHCCILPQSSCLEQSPLCRRVRPTTNLSPRVSAEWWPCLHLWSSTHQVPELGSSTVHTAPRCFPSPWPPPHLESQEHIVKHILLSRGQKRTPCWDGLLPCLINIASVISNHHFMNHLNDRACVCVCTPCLSETSHTPQSWQHTGHISGRQWRRHSLSWPSRRLHFSPKTHRENGRCRRPRNAAVSCGTKI